MEFKGVKINDLDQVVSAIIKAYPKQRLFALKGDLGAGKTTLVQAFCKFLGVTEKVTSPTFSIVNEYQGEHYGIYHFDFYRVEDPEEVMDIGIYEYLDSGFYCFMEWPEKTGSLLERESLVYLDIISSQDSRTIKVLI